MGAPNSELTTSLLSAIGIAGSSVFVMLVTAYSCALPYSDYPDHVSDLELQ